MKDEGARQRAGDVAVDGVRRLRTDAERNRQLVLTAARAVFAERGLDASLDEVAQRAGLGIGTVYRRFTDKQQLVEALFEEDLALLVADAERSASIEDPWEALVAFLQRSFDLQAGSCGLRDLMLSTTVGRERLAGIRDEIRPVARQLVERAQAAGALRPDFDPSDIFGIGIMLGAAVDFSRSVRPELWRRYLAIFLDGLRTGHLDGEPPELEVPSLSEEELDKAMACWRPRHH